MEYTKIENQEEVTPDVDALITKLVAEKKTANEYQKRKHEDWNENYELYRNKVRTNRLTQRQSVSIPLMKETIKTALSIIDDFPNIDWTEKSGDEVKEIVFQEIWNKMSDQEKLELIDILDKKNVLIYGLSTKILNLSDEYVKIMVADPYDVLYDPLMNPLNVETARYIIHQNIFKPLREILASDRYTEEGKTQLKMWAATDRGVAQSNENREALRKKEARLRAMGINSEYFANFAGGDVLVNLNAQYTHTWNTKKKEFERRVIVQAEDCYVLSDDTLEECIGVDFWPFEYWTEDIETLDIYPDSVADLIRPINKVINVWFSQLVENRTLRNFNMHWYDATVQGYQPQTYEPGQGRMLPAPGDPNKTIMPVNVDGLDGTMDAIQFLIGIGERGAGVTAIDKGSSEKGTQTLGEVQILVGKAQERAISMTPFYRKSWYVTAAKWAKMMQANEWGSFDLYKTGASGKVYKKTVKDDDWKSKAGYEPKVSSSSEQEESTVKNIQKWLFIKSQSPNNKVLSKIAQKRQLNLVDVTPQEMQEIQDEEERMEKMLMAPAQNMVPPGTPAAPQMMNPAQPQQPGSQAVDPNLVAELQSKMAELDSLPQ